MKRNASLPVERRIMPSEPVIMRQTDNVGRWHGSFQELAHDLSNVRYDRLAQFFTMLSDEIKKQSEPRYENKVLYARLQIAAQHLDAIAIDFQSATKAV